MGVDEPIVYGLSGDGALFFEVDPIAVDQIRSASLSAHQ
jgi:hypothetical protein